MPQFPTPAPRPPDDARAMVRRYGARQARRRAALPLSLLGGLGLGVLAWAMARRPARRDSGTPEPGARQDAGAA